MKEILQHIYDFLASNDSGVLLQRFRDLEWSQAARSIYTWLVIAPLLTFLLWTKKFKIITAIASFFLFLLLVQRTFSPSMETLRLHDLLVFLSGAVALVGLNIYLLFIRE